ncbi:hypothetical protein MMC18_005897 [Xylographa bjoerkii]|nr:hypothetical protein [Xylographa bjoerkii]
MSMNDVECMLARCCIWFLGLADFGKKRNAKDEDIELWQDSGLGSISCSADLEPNSRTEASLDYNHIYHNPESRFYEYVASNWANHYSASKTVIAKCPIGASTILLESLNPLIISAYFGHTSLVTRLLADDKFDSSLSAAIGWASRMGHLNIVNLLIEHGVPNIRETHDGRSAFSWASAGGFTDIVDTLLAGDKTLINICEPKGHCPLSLAVQYDHVDMVDKLLKADNVDVNLKDLQGTTPIFFAIEYGVTKAIQGLLDYSERTEDIGKLSDEPGDKKGVSPLSYAATWGHLDSVRLLCNTKQIDRQLRSVDKLDGANVVDVAAKHGHVQVIKELIKYYPEGVHSRDKTGRTPLSIAMWGTEKEVLRALLDAGADVNCQDNEGRPPISFGPNKIEMVKVLVEEHGADNSLVDCEGHTPLWYAGKLNKDTEAQLKDLGAPL